MRIFKRKTRAEVLEDIVIGTANELQLKGLTSEELVLVLNRLSERGKELLEQRAEDLEKELSRTICAIANLKA